MLIHLVVVVVSTHSLDPCLWGESDHSVFGQSVIISLHLASSSITPAGSVHTSRGDSLVRMWVQLKRWCVSCVWVLQRGRSDNGCDLASTLCKYDLRKGDLLVLSWARVRRVRRGSLSSELAMYGGGVRILHDLQFVNAGRGCKRRPYRRGILQSWSHNCLVCSHECLLLFTPSCCSECFYDL